MIAHVGSSMETLPAPCRGGSADESPADGQRVEIQHARIVIRDLWFEVGEVPFKGPALDRLEVDKPGTSVHNHYVHPVWRSMDDLTGVDCVRKGDQAFAERSPQEIAIIAPQLRGELWPVERTDRVGDLLLIRPSWSMDP